MRELVAGPALVGDVGPELHGEAVVVGHEIVVVGRGTEEATRIHARVDLDRSDSLSGTPFQRNKVWAIFPSPRKGHALA